MISQSIPDPYGTGKLPPGLVLNECYVITRKIAQGGMGAVYEAKEVPVTSTSRRLAIKEMSFSMLNHLQEVQRKAVVDSFHREYDLLSKLNHPNLVRAFEFFEENGRQYFVMEYIEGKTLESLMENLPPGIFFSLEHVMDWARQLCDALHYLHSQKPPIIYRDLKPSNIMEVADSHLIKLFDFGIARYYKPGQRSDTVRFGTDGYLAPEIIAYQTQTSVLTDVFALGAVLHQLLTRYDPQIDPWRRPSIHSVNPYVPERILSAIDHALSMNPIHRASGADRVLRELFGDQAEIEITNVAMQNPFTQTDHQLDNLVEPGIAKTGLDLPLQDKGISHQPPETMTNLDLGRVQRGQTAVGYLQVVAPPSVIGHVTCDVDWLTTNPESINVSKVRLTVSADTKNLPLSTWGSTPKPGWFSRLPKILQGWLGFHSSILIPRPCSHHGKLKITFPGHLVTVVDVAIEVHPTSLASGIGWLVIAGLMSLEIILILLMFLSMLFILL